MSETKEKAHETQGVRMKAKDIFKEVLRKVCGAFPGYLLQDEPLPSGSEQTRIISVYGVPPARVGEIKRFIQDLDWTLCMPADCGVLAHVVDEETTAEYYPEFLRIVASVNNQKEKQNDWI